MNFGWAKKQKIDVIFNGGEITSDGGMLLIKQIDKKIGLTKNLSRIIKDLRVKKKCKHSLLLFLRQLIFGIAHGYEDLNDHKQLRNDKLIQVAVGSDKQLASPSTLSRFENSINKKSLFDITNVLVMTFINSYKKAPKEIILDFDGTDYQVHGKQHGAMFNGYYNHKCFLPLYVFCGNHLLVAYLRPGNVPDSKHSGPILKLLVKKIRTYWPNVLITFRADGAFCRHKIFNWCERNYVNYITGIPANKRIIRQSSKYIHKASVLFDKTGEKQRVFGKFEYAARTWKKKRQVIIKTDRTIHGKNSRFIVTNLPGEAQWLYEKVYCARGEMENRIKEQQLCLFADRTSSSKWLTNQFRLLLSAMAYTLIEAIRNIALKGTDLAKAQCSTIRLKLLKIGAIIVRNTRRVIVSMSSTYPWQALFKKVAKRLSVV